MKTAHLKLLSLLLASLPVVTLTACADDLCKSHAPSFELRISLASVSMAQ